MAESRVVVYGALAGNTAIAVTKFVAAGFTGSSSMLSEAIHSTVDTGNSVLLLVGMKRSERKGDAEHPFGYGREIPEINRRIADFFVRHLAAAPIK